MLMLYWKGKSKLVNVRVKESEIGKDGKQVYNDVLSCWPLISQGQRDKAGYSTDTHAQSSKTAPDVCSIPPQNKSVRERRKSLPAGSTLFLFLLLHKVYTMGVNSPSLPGCVTWPSDIFWENQIPCPVAFLHRSVHWSQRLGWGTGAETWEPKWTWLLLCQAGQVTECFGDA